MYAVTLIQYLSMYEYPITVIPPIHRRVQSELALLATGNYRGRFPGVELISHVFDEASRQISSHLRLLDVPIHVQTYP